jgi:superfamily II DNA or RNA helicase
MLKNNVLWPASRRFKSRTEWEPIGFFSEALCNATQFDIKLGFFSSSAINILSDGFATFLYNGGRMRMVINDVLSIHDQQAIMAGETDVMVPFFDLQDLAEVKRTLSERDKHFFECLAWLIKNEKLEIKIVVPKEGEGIAHSKCGVFSDGLNRVAFDGSCNFSRTALIENLESLTAFCDWDGQSDICKIDDIAEDFERTFSGNDDSVLYLKAEEVKAGITSNFENKDIKELIKDEQNLISRRLVGNLPDNIMLVLNKAKRTVESIIEDIEGKKQDSISYKEPQFPYDNPRDYQQLAFENWKNNGQKGLFAMATGTGKTITSLNCLLEIYKRKGYYKALILVPTVTLVEQWEEECRKFNFNRIVKVCSNFPNWKEEIRRIQFDESFCKENENISFVIISTYSSFSREKVFGVLNSFSRTQVLLIADEAHNMGAPGLLKRLGDINYLRRIGLSATPERQFDDAGNKRIFHFFGADEKYTYEYSMAEAIENGVLCRYFYYPHLVSLTSEEMEKYTDYSIKISKYFNYNSGTFDKTDDILMSLLLARKRIIHKAANKITIFNEIVRKRFEEKGSLAYTLVYVPEGNKPDMLSSDMFDNKDTIEDDHETQHLIDQYTKAVCDIDKYVTVKKITGDTKDRDAILADFASGKLQVLTSMKCLDEGVDVPRSEMAIFCASTGNPRQFIQRRGRVLRTHKDKEYAYLHDLVVIPKVMESSPSFRMEQMLLLNELKRVNNFAQLSENPSYALTELLDVMNYYGLNLYDNTHIL